MVQDPREEANRALTCFVLSTLLLDKTTLNREVQLKVLTYPDGVLRVWRSECGIFWELSFSKVESLVDAVRPMPVKSLSDSVIFLVCNREPNEVLAAKKLSEAFVTWFLDEKGKESEVLW